MPIQPSHITQIPTGPASVKARPAGTSLEPNELQCWASFTSSPGLGGTTLSFDIDTLRGSATLGDPRSHVDAAALSPVQIIFENDAMYNVSVQFQARSENVGNAFTSGCEVNIEGILNASYSNAFPQTTFVIANGKTGTGGGFLDNWLATGAAMFCVQSGDSIQFDGSFSQISATSTDQVTIDCLIRVSWLADGLIGVSL